MVTAINGRAVRSAVDLRNKVGMRPIGETIDLRLIRDGKPLTVKIKIDKPPEVAGSGAVAVPQLAGAAVANLKAGRGRTEGVLVTEVDANSPAWLHGFRPGDIIIGVNRRKVRSIQELLAVLKASEDVLIFDLLRGDFRLTIVIR